MLDSSSSTLTAQRHAWLYFDIELQTNYKDHDRFHSSLTVDVLGPGEAS